MQRPTSIATEFYPYCGVSLPHFGHVSSGTSQVIKLRFIAKADQSLIAASQEIRLSPSDSLGRVWQRVEGKPCPKGGDWALFMRAPGKMPSHLPGVSLSAFLAFDALLFLAESQGNSTGSYEFPVALHSIETSIMLPELTEGSWQWRESDVLQEIEEKLHDLSPKISLYLAPASLASKFSGHSHAHRLEENPFILEQLAFSSATSPGTHVVFVEETDKGLKTLLTALRQVWSRGWERMQSSRDSMALGPGKELGEGRYEVVGKIGAGGFAVVYEAIDRKFNRHVAVKVITLDRSTDERREEFIRRFEREAQFASRIKHRSVVEVYDVGVIEETATPYIVMECLQGMDLSDVLEEHGPLSIERALPLFIDMLEGLGVAHEQGIVHKDLKPSNVFLCDLNRSHERLCVLDFGVARQAGMDTSRLTRTDGALGTPHYMAPEYASSQIATPALDVYQVGLILVEVLTGRPVVSHPEPMAAMFQHVRGELYLPNVLLNSPLGPVLRRALATDYEQRFENGFVFADALREMLGHTWPDIREDLSLRHVTQSASSAPRTPKVGLSDGFDSAPETSSNVVGRLEFADTMDVSLIGGLRHPQDTPRMGPPALERPPAKPEAPPSQEEEAQVVQESSLISYPSRAPYVMLSAVLLCLLGVVVWMLVRETKKPKATTNPPVVMTEYDKSLLMLRRRASVLPRLLEKGELTKLLAEVESMDKEETRLTPKEVEEIRQLVTKARAEKKNRRLLDLAMNLIQKKRDYESALATIAKINPRSIFRQHADFVMVLDRIKTALLPKVQQYRFEKRFKLAEDLLRQLTIQDSGNEELRAMLFEVLKERAMYNSSKQVIPIALPEAQDLDADMGELDGPD